MRPSTARSRRHEERASPKSRTTADERAFDPTHGDACIFCRGVDGGTMLWRPRRRVSRASLVRQRHWRLAPSSPLGERSLVTQQGHWPAGFLESTLAEFVAEASAPHARLYAAFDLFGMDGGGPAMARSSEPDRRLADDYPQRSRREHRPSAPVLLFPAADQRALPPSCSAKVRP